MLMSFDPQAHDYTEHPTYTGPGCAHCGRPVADHVSALIVKEMTKQEAEKKYGVKLER